MILVRIHQMSYYGLHEQLRENLNSVVWDSTFSALYDSVGNTSYFRVQGTLRMDILKFLTSEETYGKSTH